MKLRLTHFDSDYKAEKIKTKICDSNIVIMGGSASSSNSFVSNTNIVTNDQLAMLNKNSNNFVASTVVNQAAKCSAGMNLTQTVDLSDMIVGGDLDYSADQSQDAAISFSCVQVSSFQSDIANGIMDKMVGALNSSYSTEALDKLSQTAKASGESQFGGTGPDVTANTNATYNFNQTTNINKNIQNVLENSITNNLNLNDVSDCISQVNLAQNTNFSGANVRGNAKIGIKQSQAAKAITDCIQKKGIATSITNQAVKDLGLTVSNAADVKKASDVSQTSESEAKSVGVFQSLGDGIGSALSGLGDLISGLYTGPAIIIGCIILIILCISCSCSVALYMMNKSDGKGDSEGDEEQEGGFFKTLGLRMPTTETYNGIFYKPIKRISGLSTCDSDRWAMFNTIPTSSTIHFP
jgi:hypothetical protein